jgi:polysaccharide chain length determinant protein (PEP-CTERM system associated)
VNLQEIIANVLNHLQGMWRYRWWANAVGWLVLVGGWIYVSSVPNVYLASTRVFVDTSSLLKPLMQGLTATRNTLSEAQLVNQAMLTRPNLEKVAYRTDLALRVQTPSQMEELVTNLQERIRVKGGRENVFTIEYEDVNREKAREVVAAVLDTFVEGALGNEGDDADVTKRALASEIDVHEKRLRDAENALARFKQDNLGYMPDQFGDYYKRLQTAVSAVTTSQDKLRQVTERRDELKRQIQGESPVFGIMSVTGAQGAGCSQNAQIQQLDTELAGLRVNFTDKHPRVVSLEETIAHLQEECKKESEAARAGAAVARPPTSEPLEANPVYQSLRIQLSTAEVELAELRAQLSSGQEEVARLHRDVDRITEVEAQLKQLNRDYEVVQTRHQELLKRREDLQAKMRLDPVTDGVKYRRLEPPFAAAEPVGPNRPLLLAAVVAAAFAVGGALAFGLNQLRPVYFDRESLRHAVPFPILGSISMILTPAAMRSRRIDRVVWYASYTVLLCCGALAVMFSAPSAALFRTLMGGAGG